MAEIPSGPTRGEEAFLEAVAGQLASEGVVLGVWQYEPAPLTVDFVFDDARPLPLAIEVTRLVNPDELAGGTGSSPLNQSSRRIHG